LLREEHAFLKSLLKSTSYTEVKMENEVLQRELIRLRGMLLESRNPADTVGKLSKQRGEKQKL
jgi:hypothetical protein